MTRARRALVALLTALSLFAASVGVAARPVASAERAIRVGAPAAATILALRAAVTAEKARAVDHAGDALLGELAPPPAPLDVSPPSFVAYASLERPLACRARVSTIAARARAPPAR